MTALNFGVANSGRETRIPPSARSGWSHGPRFLVSFGDDGVPATLDRGYSLTLLLRVAIWSFLMSSGVSWGRSIVSVILLIFPVNVNGTW